MKQDTKDQVYQDALDYSGPQFLTDYTII